MITAIVFVKADVAQIPEVAEAIAALDGVSEVYSVTGQIDLIALVRVRHHDDVRIVEQFDREAVTVFLAALLHELDRPEDPVRELGGTRAAGAGGQRHQLPQSRLNSE